MKDKRHERSIEGTSEFMGKGVHTAVFLSNTVPVFIGHDSRYRKGQYDLHIIGYERDPALFLYDAVHRITEHFIGGADRDDIMGIMCYRRGDRPFFQVKTPYKCDGGRFSE